MTTQRRLLTLEQVKQTERRAWTERCGHKYYYDGIDFWVTSGGKTHIAHPPSVPEAGWWHGEECNCQLCRVEA